MCRSFSESLTSGLITTLTSLVFLATKKSAYVWLGSWLFVIGLTQYLDAYVWANGVKASQLVIQYATSLILPLELVVSYGGYVYATHNRFPLIYEISLAVYVLLMMYNWFTGKCRTTIAEDGFLHWCGYRADSPARLLFFFFLIFPFFWFPDRILGTAIITGSTYTFIQNIDKQSFTASWCHSANLLSAFTLLRFLFT
jgi:hypothetical protein